MALNHYLTRPFATFGRSTLGLLFPRVCPACQSPLPDGAAEFCGGCYQELALFSGDCCARCGAPRVYPDPTASRCVYCEKYPMNFDAAVALGSYEGLLRQIVLQAKESTGETAAAVLGRMLAGVVCQRLDPGDFDLVTCVPMHWRRRFVRQHNAPEIVGEVMARKISTAFRPRVLRTTRASQKQAELAASQRRGNVRGVFRVRRSHRLRGATVALVDDILTTGATCSEAARALKAAGAKRVVAVVAARSL